MTTQLYLPTNIDVRLDVTINAGWRQRLRLSWKRGAETVGSVWEGQGEGVVLDAPKVGPRIINTTESLVTAIIEHSSDNGITWAANKSRVDASYEPVTPIGVTEPWAPPFIGTPIPTDLFSEIHSEDGFDNDYNDVSVRFTWPGQLIGVLAFDSSAGHVTPTLSVKAGAHVKCVMAMDAGTTGTERAYLEAASASGAKKSFTMKTGNYRLLTDVDATILVAANQTSPCKSFVVVRDRR